MDALTLAYIERGLEPRNVPIRELPSFDGWTDDQIAEYLDDTQPFDVRELVHPRTC